MIDSSGRRGLQPNGTVLDVLPVGQIVGVLGALLVAFFTLVRPEASYGLGSAARFLFWTLHVGLGLSALWVASRWLASGERLPDRTLSAVLVTGFAAIALAAPGYLVLDALFEPYIIDLDPESETEQIPYQLIKEVLELTPWFITAWLLINLPVLIVSSSPSVQMNDVVDKYSDDDRSDQLSENSRARNSVDSQTLPKSLASNGVKDIIDSAPLQNEQPTRKFLLSLPGIIGTDVVAVSSDLHYLNVWTVAGRTTILGKLHEVVAELDGVGMQVHRSHWVSHAHVRRIVGNASNAACILSNELRVPISRRRWKDVREYYGRGVLHGTDNDVQPLRKTKKSQ